MGRIIGKKIKRVDAYSKVTGKAKYAADLFFDRMIYAYPVISRVSHGILKKIDISEAMKLSGTVDIITHKDIPGSNSMGETVKDMFCLIPEGEKIRYFGDVVAIALGKTQKDAELAARNVRFKIEELKPVYTIEEAIKNETLIHKDSNILDHKKIYKGNIDQDFSDCYEYEGDFFADYQEQAYLETQGIISIYDEDETKIYGTMQCPFYVQRAVSEVLELPLNRVRVIQTETGGGFGGKEEVPSIVAAYASVASYKTKRPVKLIYSRDVDIQITSKRHPIKTHYKITVDKNKKIKAMEVKGYMDMGAYANLSPIVLYRSLIHAAGCYEIENVKVDLYSVYTNKVSAGAFRGFGSPQVLFAVESAIDEIAKNLNVDPIEFRLKNILKLNSKTSTDQILRESVGAEETLNDVKEQSNWDSLKSEIKEFNDKNKEKKRGLGVSLIFYGNSLGAGGQRLDKSGAEVVVNIDGTVNVRIGGTEMGQGAKTVITMIASEELGQNVEKIKVSNVDTAFLADSGPTVASRLTMFSGNAVKNASRKIKDRLFDLLVAEKKWVRENIVIGDGEYCYKDEKIKFEELIQMAYGKNCKLFEAGWYESPEIKLNFENGLGDAYITYSYASQISFVEVDLLTGNSKVLKVWSSHDVGKALNYDGVVGQIQGGFVQGMGYAIYENIKTLNGKIITDGFSTYLIPTIRDIPENIFPDIVEMKYSQGPYGAKGIGEPSLIPAPVSIPIAISRAIDKRVDKIPVTAEYILEKLEEVEN
jgi:CO/xanthine dehydrogenase Mo-binding subunit